MGTHLSSIALVALAATLLSSIAQASPSGDAIEPKSDSTVCVVGHYNADHSAFICDVIEPKLGSMACVEGHYNADHSAFICDATKPKSDSMVCVDWHHNADDTFTCNQFIESQQWFERDLHGMLDNDRPRPVAQKDIFFLVNYQAPYGGSSEYLLVRADGRVSYGLNQDDGLTGGACKGCWKGRINTQQLMQFEQKINQLPLAPQSERPKEIKGKSYTVIFVQQHGAFVRRDYVGALPPDLARFVAETDSLVKHSEWFSSNPRK